MTASVVYSPFADLSPIELAGGKWRKLVLPVGDISYQGRMLHFTREYLQGLVQSFRARAYDAVPFQLADASNAHTNDPERYRGKVTNMQADDRGLWVEVEPTEAGAQLLATNPELGISARIIEQYDRSDGRHFPAAIQHVLGTLDPRIPALGPWTPVETSNSYGGQVLDLSNMSWEGYHRYTDLAAAASDADSAAFWDAVERAADEGDDETLRQLLGDAYDGSEEFTPEELAELDKLAEDPEAGPAIRELQAAALSNTYGAGSVRELAGDFSQFDEAFELANRQAEQAVNRDRVRVAEQGRMRGLQAEAGHRQPGTEHKLEALYGRIAKGTYLPAPGFEFGSYGWRDITLSQLRRSQDVIELAGAADVGAALTACGVLDATGRCGSPQHEIGCSAVHELDHYASPEGRRELAEAAFRPSDGLMYSDVLESMTGIKGSQYDSGLFEEQKLERETIKLQRTPVYGDPDSDERDSVPMDDAATKIMVSQLRDAMGISTPERASRAARQQTVTDRRAVAGLKTPMQRAGLDTSDWETYQERAGRASQRAMVPLDDGLGGVVYTKAAAV